MPSRKYCPKSVRKLWPIRPILCLIRVQEFLVFAGICCGESVGVRGCLGFVISRSGVQVSSSAPIKSMIYVYAVFLTILNCPSFVRKVVFYGNSLVEM